MGADGTYFQNPHFPLMKIQVSAFKTYLEKPDGDPSRELSPSRILKLILPTKSFSFLLYNTVFTVSRVEDVNFFWGGAINQMYVFPKIHING